MLRCCFNLMLFADGRHVNTRGSGFDRVAVKRVPLVYFDKRTVLREIDMTKTASRAAPSHVCAYIDHHKDEDHICIAYEPADCSAEQWVLREPRTPPAARLRVLKEVLAGLRDLHRGGVAHNDLHAGNVLLVLDVAGAPLRVKLVDFQLSSARSNAGMNTFTFRQPGMNTDMARLAPESRSELQSARSVDGRAAMGSTDVYTFGTLAVELLTGAPCSLDGSGAVDRAPLAKAGLSPRVALEVGHLLDACLRPLQAARPSASAISGHPLWWSAKEAGDRIVALNDAKVSEETLRSSLRAAKMDEAVTALERWQTAVHPPLLQHMERNRRSKDQQRYEETLSDLLRFVRNALAHPPPPKALPAALLPGDAVLAHLSHVLPWLMLAVHVVGGPSRR